MVWRLLWTVLVQAVVVTVLRVVRGPRLPRWTWLMELFQRALLRLGRRVMARAEGAIPLLRLPPPRRALPGIARTHVDAGGVPAEWVAASDAPDLPVLLYLHGGGYVMCSVDTHVGLIAEFARALPARVLAPNYRLAPEHPFPAAVDDAVTVYRWLLDHGTRPADLAVAGDSAGGGLTLALLIALRDAGLPQPSCAVCLSPWTDLAVTGASVTENAGTDYLEPAWLQVAARWYVGDADARTPLASPLYADLHGLPPLRVHAGGAELIRDDATRLVTRACAAGVAATVSVYPEMFHVWHAFLDVSPDARAAMRDLEEFLRTHLRRGPAGRRV